MAYEIVFTRNPESQVLKVTARGALPDVGETSKRCALIGPPHHLVSLARESGPKAPADERPCDTCHLATAAAVSEPKNPVALALRYPSPRRNSWRLVTSSPREPRARPLLSAAAQI